MTRKLRCGQPYCNLRLPFTAINLRVGVPQMSYIESLILYLQRTSFLRWYKQQVHVRNHNIYFVYITLKNLEQFIPFLFTNNGGKSLSQMQWMDMFIICSIMQILDLLKKRKRKWALHFKVLTSWHAVLSFLYMMENIQR